MIKLSIGTKTNAATRMIFCRGYVFDDYFRFSETAGRFAITNYANTHFIGFVRIGEVNEMVSENCGCKARLIKPLSPDLFDVRDSQTGLGRSLPFS